MCRGTAACGYAALQAVLVSGGRMITRPIPKGKQLDWEVLQNLHMCGFPPPPFEKNFLFLLFKAILSRNCDQFVSKVLVWLQPLSPCDSKKQAAEYHQKEPPYQQALQKEEQDEEGWLFTTITAVLVLLF